MSIPHHKKPIIVPRFKESNGFVTTSKRSKLMGKIKSKNTKPELALRKALWALKLRYRIHSMNVPGKPDILFNKYKLVIFIDGEFWHGYNWDIKKNTIKTNREFWIPKIERNMERDKENTAKLNDLGFYVLRFWEAEIKKDLNKCIQIIISYIDLRLHG